MKRVLVVGAVVAALGGCVVRPAGGPMYAAPIGGYAAPGWPVVPPPFETRTPPPARPSFAPPPMVHCTRLLGGTVQCQ